MIKQAFPDMRCILEQKRPTKDQMHSSYKVLKPLSRCQRHVWLARDMIPDMGQTWMSSFYAYQSFHVTILYITYSSMHSDTAAHQYHIQSPQSSRMDPSIPPLRSSQPMIIFCNKYNVLLTLPLPLLWFLNGRTKSTGQCMKYPITIARKYHPKSGICLKGCMNVSESSLLLHYHANVDPQYKRMCSIHHNTVKL